MGRERFDLPSPGVAALQRLPRWVPALVLFLALRALLASTHDTPTAARLKEAQTAFFRR
jgi:hypothetical protein